MRRWRLIAIGVLAICVTSAAGAANTLRIFFIDVEGGQSTLLVDPRGESLLIDAGFPGSQGRDADRILAAAKAAGINHIDYLVITHYHLDHVGGVPELAARIKINEFIDHGPNTEFTTLTRQGYADYVKAVGDTKRVTLKPGDRIPLEGMDVQVLTAAAKEITSPLEGAGQPNPACALEPKPLADHSENAQSVGLLITYGKFRFIDLGDLTTKGELGLACPNNLIGTVDLYLTTHHGTAHPGTDDSSNARAIVDALHPRVAVMNNGLIKGGNPIAWQIVHDSAGLEDLWQLHYSMAGGEPHNVADQFIANPKGEDHGYYIEVSAQRNAVFTVINSRNNFQKTYKKQPKPRRSARD